MEIERVDLPLVSGSDGEDSANGCESSDGGECFVVVDAFDLGKTFRDNSSLVLVDFAF